jgi:hypothetical protein
VAWNFLCVFSQVKRRSCFLPQERELLWAKDQEKSYLGIGTRFIPGLLRRMQRMLIAAK